MRYWKKVNQDNKTNAVESYSHDLDIEGAIEITETEFKAYIASLPIVEPEPIRDLASEIDSLKSRIEKLEVKSAELGI